MEPGSPLPCPRVAASPCEPDGGACDGSMECRSQESGDSKSCTGGSNSVVAAGGVGTAAAEGPRITGPGRKPKRIPVSAAIPPPEPPRPKKKQRATACSPAVDGNTADPMPPPSMVPASASTAAAVLTRGGSRQQLESPVEDDTAGGDERAKELQRLQRELSAVREQFMQQKRRLHATVADRAVTKKALSGLLVQIARTENAEERDRFAAQKYQLGLCKHTASGLGARGGVWEGGYEAEAVTHMKDLIRDDRLTIERLRRQLKKQAKGPANASTGSSGPGANFGDDGGANGGENEDEADDEWQAREINTCRISFLTREESAIKEREQRLHVDRVIYMKRVQRLEAADRSNFRNHPLLSEDRYQLLNLIGRGGFSEVYRAYDLEGNKYCAVKIHELGKEMSDQQRQSYIRRAMREYEIQKTLKHPRVVTLQDCFAISTKAFGTVLELCEGETLGEYLQRNSVNGALPEREARGITIQILSGLKYMNTNGRKIIHYDLKPGNLFFYNGEIKIADFGLSKVVQESFGESIDLTSQGAGTYWYLPPECFVAAGQEPPKISNKVDVWSTGVIFYELLFNRRPFGHNQSQEALLRASMSASQPFALEIPLNPKGSVDAKGFLRRLLTINREDRPDVLEAFNDPYLRSRSRATGAGAAGVVGVGLVNNGNGA